MPQVDTTQPLEPAPGQARHFPCESCGADLEFHIGAQQLQCPYCGFQKRLQQLDKQVLENELEPALARLAEQSRTRARPVTDATSREINCEACGAIVVFDATLTSSECAYCASPIQLKNAHAAPFRLPVDGVLPFAVSRELAQEALRAWVKSRWFAPNAFKKKGVQGKFNGVYLPFYTFDAMTSSYYEGQRGTRHTRSVGSGKNRRTVTEIRWRRVSGHVEGFYDDVLVLAVGNAKTKLVQALEPWPLENLRPFSDDVLAGYQARTYDIELAGGFEHAKVRIDEAIARAIRRDIGGDAQRIDHVSTSYSALKYKHILLPLWLLTYRFHEKAYQVLVNAQTAEVQGERPYSWVKITLAVLAGLVAVGAFVYLQNR